jgi:hypothetical protein
MSAAADGRIATTAAPSDPYGSRQSRLLNRSSHRWQLPKPACKSESGPRCGKRPKMARYAPFDIDDSIHRTVTTRRADFKLAVRLIRRDRSAPVMMLMHEECRITCDHRHSLWYLTCSLDCGLSRNAIRQWFVRDFVPMAAASGIAASASLCGESRTLHFDKSLSPG